uniref:Uncharacterized protein n=1 Tax=Branchiostoma floridae TaxID=7739 RepID=C3XXU6_BRAFL|eukprot:XP_002611546.1 hypothetical protein BRAFLDRAFT_63815 [Branchiostoma floridae]
MEDKEEEPKRIVLASLCTVIQQAHGRGGGTELQGSGEGQVSEGEVELGLLSSTAIFVVCLELREEMGESPYRQILEEETNNFEKVVQQGKMSTASNETKEYDLQKKKTEQSSGA